jgi:hypothetical protein
VSQEECKKLRESVPYVKLYRYNPKHLYPKLNGFGDNGQRSLKLWQLLLTYWLPNTYWNWQEYVIYVMLISVLNIKVTCEWQKSIKLNYKNTRTNAVVVLRVPSTLRSQQVIALSRNADRDSYSRVQLCAFMYKPPTSGDRRALLTKHYIIYYIIIIYKFGPCPVFDELYPGICLTNEGKKHGKNLS